MNKTGGKMKKQTREKQKKTCKCCRCSSCKCESVCRCCKCNPCTCQKMKKDKFKEFAGEFKNEANIEEELDEEEIDINDAEKNHYEEWDEQDNE